MSKAKSLALVIMLMFIIGCTSQKVKDEYKKKINDITELMTLTGPIAGEVCSAHSEAWRLAISTGHDFNWAISNSLVMHADNIGRVRSAKAVLGLMMSNIKSPPKDFELAHAKLVSVYGTYCSLMDAAISPSGSLITYNQNVNRLIEEFTKGMNELKVITP